MTPAQTDYLVARRAILQEIRELLIGALKLPLEPERIDPDVPLFGTGLGLDSVDAVELVVQLDSRFGLQLAGTPHLAAELRTVNSVVDAVMRRTA